MFLKLEYFRNQLQKAPLVAMVLVVGLFCIASVILFWWKFDRSSGESLGYYFDLQTGHVFVASRDRLTPMAVPGADEAVGLQGVRAYLFSCRSCEEEHDRFVGWIEMHNPQTVEKLRVHHGGEKGRLVESLRMAENATVVAAPSVSGPQWYPANDRFVLDLKKAVHRRCGAETIQRCEP